MARLSQISVSDGGAPKRPVPSAHITVDGVSGDRQRSPKIHGGPDRAVCLFSLEVIEALRAEGHPIEAGSIGENLTFRGVDWATLAPGHRMRVGQGVVLEITSYTEPCDRIAGWFKDRDFQRVWQERFPGWSRLYARVLAEGMVTIGDEVVIEKEQGQESHGKGVSGQRSAVRDKRQ